MKYWAKCLYLHSYHMSLEWGSPSELFLKGRTQFRFLVNLLQNHYQWQSKSIQIKLKLIIACGSEMSIAIPSTGLFGGFSSGRECHVEWCLKRQSRKHFTVLSLHEAESISYIGQCLSKERDTETLEFLFSFFGNITSSCGLQNCWVGGVWNFSFWEKKQGMANNT